MEKEKLELKLEESQTVHMRVGSQILEHLSKGIYSNPARAIKELINNAFDANATKVIVRAKPEFDTFEISDNGEGMNYEDFNENFLFISRSNKRDKGNFTPKPLERPVIGRVGIGFVAVSQICNKMTVISSKRNQNFKLEAEIDFSKFRKIEHKKKDFYDLSEIKFSNYREEKNAHYTKVILTGLLNDFKELLEDKDIKKEEGIEIHSFDGLKFEQIIDQIEKKKLDLSKNIGLYWQTVLEIANTVPVRYLDKGPIRVSPKNYNDFEKELRAIDGLKDYIKKLNFSVDFDGIELKKPILVPNEEDIIKKDDDFNIYLFNDIIKFEDGSVLKFKGYIYNQKRSIYPSQLRGIIIRIKSVAIGGIDPDFLSYMYAEKMFLPWTFGEIYVEEGLEDAMNINRSSFTITHPHYRKLRNRLHKFLHKTVFRYCRDRYIDRIEKVKKKEEILRDFKIKDYLNFMFNRNFNVDISEKSSEIPIDIDTDKGSLIVYSNHPVFKKISKKNKITLQNILVLFEASFLKSKGNLEEMKKYFYEGLNKMKSYFLGDLKKYLNEIEKEDE